MFLRSCHHNNSCDSKDNGGDDGNVGKKDTSGNDNTIGDGYGGNDDSCDFIKSS